MSVTLNNAPDPINPRPRDPTATSLLLCNILVIAIALIERWDLGFVMVVYWWQNIIIGYFNVLKMWHAQNIVPAHLAEKLSEKNLKMPSQGKIFLILFFIVHYGFFHFGYYNFLQKDFKHVDSFWVAVSASLFFLNHWFSYRRHRAQDEQNQNIVMLFIMPYPRIIPMHVTIIFGGMAMLILQSLVKDPQIARIGQQCVIVFFLAIKTRMDLKMHALEHDPRGFLKDVLSRYQKKVPIP